MLPDVATSLTIKMMSKMNHQRATIENAWQRAGRRCECRRAHHRHPGGGCAKRLNWVNRGRHGDGAWEAQRQPGPDGGYQILCWDCHAKDI